MSLSATIANLSLQDWPFNIRALIRPARTPTLKRFHRCIQALDIIQRTLELMITLRLVGYGFRPGVSSTPKSHSIERSSLDALNTVVSSALVFLLSRLSDSFQVMLSGLTQRTIRTASLN